MRVIVGLGNPGSQYADTRHNLGEMVVRHLAQELGLSFKNQPSFKAHTAVGEYEGIKVGFLIPQTFMNLSGEAVGPFLNFYKLDPSSLLVLHDELDIELGLMKFSRSSSSAGHRGIESLIRVLGTKDFDRVRLGISRPKPGRSGADYVLERFASDENGIVEKVIHEATDAVLFCIKNGVEAAMNRFNKKNNLTSGK